MARLSLLRLALAAACLALAANALVTPPPPEAVVSCPGMKRTGDQVSCTSTPVRIQAVVSVDALRARGITDCETFDYSAHAAADCDGDGQLCYDSRDCCSDFCDFQASGSGAEDGKCAAPPVPLRRRLRAPRALTHEQSPNPEEACVHNAECISYRCVAGFCDDEVGAAYAGSDDCLVPGLGVLFTLQLAGEPTPGNPNITGNDEHTQWLEPGDYEDLSFPGRSTFRARTEYCGTANGGVCTQSSVASLTVVVDDNAGNHADALPPKNSDHIFIRSAIQLNVDGFSWARFNASAFRRAVAETLNTDRLQYTRGKSVGAALYAAVKVHDINIILIDPPARAVQYEVRTKSEAEAVPLSERLLHAYFKFPLCLYMMSLGVVGNQNQAVHQAATRVLQQATRIHVKAESAELLIAEQDSESKSGSLTTALAAGFVVLIIVGALAVLVAAGFVVRKSTRLDKVAAYQASKEQSLNMREADLQRQVKALDAEKSRIQQESAELQKQTSAREAELAAAEARLREVAAAETSEIDALDKSLNQEHEAELADIEAKLEREQAQVLQHLAQGGDHEVALDADSVDHRMDALIISAGASADEAQRELDARHAKMKARLAHRNEVRKAKLARRLEQEEADALAKLETAKVSQQTLELRVGEMTLSSTQDAQALKAALDERRAAVMRRTQERNAKRAAKLESMMQEEKRTVASSCTGTQTEPLKLPAVLGSHDDLLPPAEAEEERALLGADAADDDRVDAVILRANMSQDEIATQLAKRREMILARTRARNAHRKQQLINKKRQEQAANMPESTRKASMDVHRLQNMVFAAQQKLKSNDIKCKSLEAKAADAQREFSAAQDEKRKKMKERLAARKKKKHTK